MKTIRVIFLIFFIISLITALCCMKSPETDLLSGFLSCNTKKENYVAKLSQHSGNQLNIIIKSNNLNEAEELTSLVEYKIQELNKNKDETQQIYNIYKKYPINFLCENTRELLKNKKYEAVSQNSLKKLYNPFGIFISPLDKDPYLFAGENILNDKYNLNEFIESEGNVYNLLRFECTDKNDIKTIQNIAKELESENLGEIYLSGSPIHTYETSKRSAYEINIICILSMLMVVILCKSYFQSFKFLLPIALSISFGLVFGFICATLIFKQLHILTFVFSTSLIGISFDYSIHYFSSANNNNFKRSLFVSMVSTVLTFTILYFTNIEILKQISVFVSFGLIGVYLFVIHILPLFNRNNNITTFNFPKVNVPKNVIISVLLIVILSGLIKLHFDDGIKNIYKPSSKLQKAESLYQNIFNAKPTNFIIVEGENINNILKKEEQITENLRQRNISYIALTDFVSSKEKQAENINLVKELYKNNPAKYTKNLNITTKAISNNYPIYSPEDFPLNKKFMLDEKTSFITVFSDAADLNPLNITSEITKILKNVRHKCLIFLPIIFLILYTILRYFYNRKQAITIILSPFIGGLTALALLSLFRIPVNVFHLLAFILIIGFSLDYSIFRSNQDTNTNSAVLVSCISTVFSFLMLSFTGFKLISSLGITLTIGILTSYLLSLVLIPIGESDNV